MDVYFWCKLTGWSPVTCIIVIMLIVTIGVLLSTGLGLSLVKAYLDWLDRRDRRDNNDSENN